MQGRTRVMVIDDHEIARAGIVLILERAPDLAVVGAVGSAEEALGMLDALTPAVVLLDYRLRGMNGAVACGEIARRRPGWQQRGFGNDPGYDLTLLADVADD